MDDSRITTIELLTHQTNIAKYCNIKNDYE
jgi:hypothetical protein